jgi:hypothetical protein
VAWTSPKTWSVAEKVTAALMNLHLRDNLLYLKGLLDGSGSDQVRVPSSLVVLNDSNFYVGNTSTTDRFGMGVDTNDWWDFDRVANTFRWIIGGGLALTLDSGGKLSGAGFYDSGEVSVSAGSTQGFAHGLGAQPRFLAVYFGTAGSTTNIATPAFLSVGATVRYSANSNTTISVTNNHGSAWTVRVFAMK